MTFLEKICSELNKQKVQFAIVGGYAVALHGAVRGTVDIDFVVKWRLDTLSSAEKSLIKLGLVSKIPVQASDVYHFRKEYIENRNLIAWNFYNPNNPVEQVDIIINFGLEQGMVKNMKVGSTTVPVLDIQPLIKMKRQSGREQDLLDVDALMRLQK
jgi:hypothetical protein